MAEDPEGLEAVTTLQTLAERVAQGGVLGDEDAPVVFQSHDLIAIGMMADDVRRQLHGAERRSCACSTCTWMRFRPRCRPATLSG